MTPTESRYAQIKDALGLEHLSVEEQEEILLDLDDMIQKGTLMRIVERMEDKTKSEFMKLAENEASEEEMDRFLREHVPEAQKALEETVEEITNDILATRKQ